MVKAIYCLLFTVLIKVTVLSAQENKHEIDLGFGTSVGFGKAIPFWHVSNRYALLDYTPFNFYSRVAYKKAFSDNKNIDYSAGISIVNRYSDHFSIYPEELYATLRLYFLDIQAGSKRETFGNQDDLLSSGGLLWSGNARPLPKISIFSPEYFNIPLTRGYLQLKGGLSHGWFGDNPYVKNTFLHHKYIYGKVGGDLPVNFSIGLHHFAQWGGVSANPEYGRLPSDLSAFRDVFFAGSGKSNSPVFDQENAAGNHLGSYNLGLEIKLTPLNVNLYWQSIFEDNSGRTNQNLWDGLYGMSLEFKKATRIKKVLFEVLSTVHQSGKPIPDYPVDGPPPEWNDNYFNNWLYRMGWSYHDMTLGSPFITSPLLMQVKNDYQYFFNNRVRAIHAGVTGQLPFLEYKVLYTHTENLGTYAMPFKPAKNQDFLLLELMFSQLIKSVDVCISVGLDRGSLLGNNTGILFSLVRKFAL